MTHPPDRPDPQRRDAPDEPEARRDDRQDGSRDDPRSDAAGTDGPLPATNDASTGHDGAAVGANPGARGGASAGASDGAPGGAPGGAPHAGGSEARRGARSERGPGGSDETPLDAGVDADHADHAEADRSSDPDDATGVDPGAERGAEVAAEGADESADESDSGTGTGSGEGDGAEIAEAHADASDPAPDDPSAARGDAAVPAGAPLEALRELVAERWPDARLALLAGSTARGRATPASDLDLLVLLPGTPAPYRESFDFRGWPLEAFVHSEASLAEFSERDAARRRPSLPQMLAEGRVLHDPDGRASALKLTALGLLAGGPTPLDDATLDAARYRLTDLLQDLRGAAAADASAVPFVAAELTLAAAEFALDAGGHWRGGSSWTPRRLEVLAPGLARRLADALRAALDGDPQPLTRAVDALLEPHGGRLFAGYRSAGGPDADGSA